MNSNSILFVINYSDRGGAGKMMKYVANLCSANFAKVIVLSLYEREKSKDLTDSITFIPLCRNESRSLLSRLFLMIKLRKEIKKQAPNVVCSFVSDVCVMTRISTFLLKCKIVSAERGDPYTLPFIWKFLVKFAYQSSDYCFFQLPLARDYFGKKVREKSFVIPNVFVQEKGVFPYNGKRKKTIVSAGRFVAEKRYENLIEAFSYVYKKHKDYKLIIYGDGPMLGSYKDQIEKLGISNVVIFPGYIPGIAKAVREDGIFVLSSKFEGIPNSLIEALSVGIPCVATDCTPGGPRYLSNDGVNALLVPVDDIDAMSTAIMSIIEDDNVARQLEINGPSILTELTDTVISKKWLESFSFITNSE